MSNTSGSRTWQRQIEFRIGVSIREIVTRWVIRVAVECRTMRDSQELERKVGWAWKYKVYFDLAWSSKISFDLYFFLYFNVYSNKNTSNKHKIVPSNTTQWYHYCITRFCILSFGILLSNHRRDKLLNHALLYIYLITAGS